MPHFWAVGSPLPFPLASYVADLYLNAERRKTKRVGGGQVLVSLFYLTKGGGDKSQCQRKEVSLGFFQESFYGTFFGYTSVTTVVGGHFPAAYIIVRQEQSVCANFRQVKS
jgi:hypothetical protein